MRTQGMLVKWNEDRGFGFIKTRDSGIEIFVHVSAFPRSGRRPQVGDPLAFEIASAADGRKQAQSVTFDVPLGRADFSLAPLEKTSARSAPASPRSSKPDRERHHRGSTTDRESPGLLFTLLVGGLLIGAIVFGHRKFLDLRAEAVDALRGNNATLAPTTSASSPADSPAEPAAPSYRCDGRQHCSQMNSCAEATWFVRHCPNTKMDGDNDGFPCEQGICG
jgi:cold shock CspA family protein